MSVVSLTFFLLNRAYIFSSQQLQFYVLLLFRDLNCSSIHFRQHYYFWKVLNLCLLCGRPFVIWWLIVYGLMRVSLFLNLSLTLFGVLIKLHKDYPRLFCCATKTMKGLSQVQITFNKSLQGYWIQWNVYFACPANSLVRMSLYWIQKRSWYVFWTANSCI